MKIRYIGILCGLTMGLAYAATQDIGIIATDFDKVLSVPSKTGQGMKAMGILGFKDTARGLWLLATSAEFRKKVRAAQDTNLKDVDGRPVIGSEAYVNYLFKDVPFISEDKKKRLANVELYFKPNVELIEYYQWLQHKGIPVYVWTDNDEGGYQRKLNALNEELKKLGKRPFEPNGFHCAKPGTKEPGYSKIDPEYFRIAYEKLQADHGALLQDKAVLFLDDKPENIASALKAAQDYNLNLDALLYNATKKIKLAKVEERVQVIRPVKVIKVL